MLFKKKFFFKIVHLKKIFFVEILLFKTARKTQNMRILRRKLNQNVIFCVQTFFKIVIFKNNFFLQNRAF